MPLTAAQRATLLVLMIKAAPVPNTFLTNVAKVSLKPDYRKALVDEKLINVTVSPIVMELTEKGWAYAIEELGAEAPPRAGALGGTLYVLLDYLRGYLDLNNLAAAQFFVARAEAVDLETRIRKTYAQIARSPGDYIMLASLRDGLADAARAEVDAALVALERAPEVNLIPESNQKVLTAAERAAAVRIGNQDKHLIAIGS